MRRLVTVGFAWLIALVLVATPMMTAPLSSVSAQTGVGTPIADDPTSDETAVDDPSEEASPTPEVTEPVVEPPATDVPSDTPDLGGTPIEASPVDEPTEGATATPTATTTPDFTSAAVLSDITITVKCATSPETVRVTNNGADVIQLTSFSTFIDLTADEPFALSRNLKPGTTAIFQSGQGAQYGTVLTTSYLFTNSAYDAEGVKIGTSVGEAVQMCDPKPLPPPPPVGKLSDLKVTLSCTTDPETIRVTNNGAGWITLKGIATYIDPIADEPFAIMPRRVLKPGQTAIYQSGPGAKYGTILTTQSIFTNAAYEKDGVRISTDVGKLYKACPAKPVPPERWIEVNLSAQYLTAWVGNTKVNGTYVSTGKPGFETPTGTFRILYRYWTQTMAGCIQGECYYVPDVPWVQYFTNYGHALHGAYWHNDFGTTRSHGCVNLPLPFAEWLWYWATYGTRVWIHY
jgi:hypothetical protein